MSIAFKDEKALRHLVRALQGERDADKRRIVELEVFVDAYDHYSNVNGTLARRQMEEARKALKESGE